MWCWIGWRGIELCAFVIPPPPWPILPPTENNPALQLRKFLQTKQKGVSHLASVRIVGNKGYPRRSARGEYVPRGGKVQNDVNLMSYYLKTRRAAAANETPFKLASGMSWDWRVCVFIGTFGFCRYCLAYLLCLQYLWIYILWYGWFACKQCLLKVSRQLAELFSPAHASFFMNLWLSAWTFSCSTHIIIINLEANVNDSWPFEISSFHSSFMQTNYRDMLLTRMIRSGSFDLSMLLIFDNCVRQIWSFLLAFCVDLKLRRFKNTEYNINSYSLIYIVAVKSIKAAKGVATDWSMREIPNLNTHTRKHEK